jgi:hypothetical protein
MSLVCRSFSADGEPESMEFPFSAQETREIELEARSFSESNWIP